MQSADVLVLELAEPVEPDPGEPYRETAGGPADAAGRTALAAGTGPGAAGPAHAAAFRLTGDAASVGTARARARVFFEGLEPPMPAGAAADALLAVSELVTNAVRHAPGPCTVELAWRGGELRVAVTDGGEALPVPRPPMADGTGGFGLPMLQAVSGHAIEVRRSPGHGKTVSVRMALAGSPRRPA